MPNPMMRSLFKSADMEEDLSITLVPMVGFRHLRGLFGVVFHLNPMVRSLYKSADTKQDLSLTLEPMIFRHMRGHFGLVSSRPIML